MLVVVDMRDSCLEKRVEGEPESRSTEEASETARLKASNCNGNCQDSIVNIV